MLRSTISTGSYVLTKYSRSYPSATSAPSAVARADQLDWQHFVNPVIRLVLDVQKASNGDLESVRLRILWNMTTGQDAMDIDQREIVFEDIDLLSFSTMPSAAAPQNLPLKAVYRDSVVGIRYQHPRVCPPNTPASYRRFQINFSTQDAAGEFVNAIRPVCPCKANAIPGQTPQAMAPMVPPASNAGNLLMSSTSSRAPAVMRYNTMLPPNPDSGPSRPLITRASTNMHRGIMLPPDRNSRRSEQNAHPSSSPGLSLLPSDPPAPHYPLPGDSIAGRASHSFADFQLPRDQVSQEQESRPGTQGSYRNKVRDISSLVDNHGSSLPASSLPPSSSPPFSAPVVSQIPVPSASISTLKSTESLSTAARAMEPDRSAFLTSLRETPALYGLSRSELEGLVSQVVREPGFIKLLENLNTLWTVKGYIAQ
ncbi:hypothetical protein BV25DRAFT_1899609 [Artomyces pyxidatus]|uniref:Uncharacterized protein n=1 Tax=Artomyces pyxidatus TaxID=48021 RepID=A0ACB8T3U5_9AGAM|nr:hypothetical protein BV25DRAFT_1899609 [Artomyces pyxidatus]